MQPPSIPLRDDTHREPLWDRVDRNRVRLALYVSVFVVLTVGAFDATLAVVWAAASLLLLVRSGTPVTAASWSVTFTALSLLFALCALAWALLSISRSERWLLRRFDAHLVPRGELYETKLALKDMAIAAGLPCAPALHLLETSNVNACALATPGRRPVIAVTSGMIDRLTVDEQRAVFASLVARIGAGDTMVATGVTALLWPLHAWRDAQLARQNRALNDVLLGSERSRPSDYAPILLLLAPLALIGELLAFGYRTKQLKAAEKADAEGMLLLKDPMPMLQALEKCVRYDNVVVHSGETFADLFYCWTGDSTNDEDDPEWRRVSRLREVLGVFGVPDESRIA